MTVTTDCRYLQKAYLFFKEHAGYIVGERAKGALQLAKAERWAVDSDYEFEWQSDPDADYSFVETWTKKEQQRWKQDAPHFAYSCLMKDSEGEVVQSLSGIIDPDNEYHRVVEAELALQEYKESGAEDLEHDVGIITKFLKGMEEWVEEYVKSDDYMYGYLYILKENQYYTEQKLKDYIRDWTTVNSYHLPKGFLKDLFEYIDYSNLIEARVVDQYSSETNGYLDSLSEEEYEQQIDIETVVENCKGLRGEVAYALEAIDKKRDFCLRLDGLDRSGHFYMFVHLGLRIDYYISEDNLKQAVVETICKRCRHNDFNRNGELYWNPVSHRFEKGEFKEGSTEMTPAADDSEPNSPVGSPKDNHGEQSSPVGG